MARIIVLLLAAFAIKQSRGVETSLSDTFILGTIPFLPVEISDYPGIGIGLKNATVKAMQDFLSTMDEQLGFNMANSLKVIEQPITNEFQRVEILVSQITENTQVGYFDNSMVFFTSTFLRIVNIVNLGQPQLKSANAKQVSAQIPSPRLDLNISVEVRYSQLAQLVDSQLKNVRNWMYVLLDVGIQAIGAKASTLQQEYRKQELPPLVSYALGAASGLESYEAQLQTYTTDSVWNNYVAARQLLRDIDINNIQ